MSDWTPPPEPLTWDLANSISVNGGSFHTVTLRAPTGADILKATGVRGAGNAQIGMQLIAAVSMEGMPYEAVQLLPTYLIEQMNGYLDLFGGAPEPAPLAAWRKAMAEAAAAPATEAPQPS
jgi:hypothetical protein